MEAFVVMGNDFPDAVFPSEEATENYIADKIEQDRKSRERKERLMQIHWRWYEFEMR